MPVDDVWKEPEFEKASRFWKICRFIALAWTVFLSRVLLGESVHEISNNVVCATSKASVQPAHACSLIRDFASRLSIL